MEVGKEAIDETQKMLAAFTFGGSSGSGGLAAWKRKELGTERPGRPGRKTVNGTGGTQSKVMKAQNRRMEKKKKLEKTQRKSDEW